MEDKDWLKFFELMRTIIDQPNMTAELVRERGTEFYSADALAKFLLLFEEC